MEKRAKRWLDKKGQRAAENQFWKAVAEGEELDSNVLQVAQRI
jgi:hypothetical protein